jgi:flagellar hook-length control protein FliK
VDALKTTGQAAAKHVGPAAKAKTETVPETGAFSKLLLSVSNEEGAPEKSAPAELLAKLQEALEALDGIPFEELTPEQQELLTAMVEGLMLQTPQLETKIWGQNPDYVKTETASTAQTGPITENQAVKLQLQPELVELMHQIAQKVQDLQSNSNKEFAVGPIFMGVEKEYILNEPKKVNEGIKLLQEVVAELQNGGTEDGNIAAAKLLGQAGEVLQQASGFANSLEAAAPDRPEVLPIRLQAEPAIVKVQEAPVVRMDLAEPESPAAPVDAAKAAQSPARTEAPAPAPSVRLANLAEDLSGVLKNSLKLTGTGENAAIKVSIFPEHLGHLEIRLSTVDGKVAAHIFTSNLLAKEALDLQVYQLRNSLVQQGITVDRIEISQQGANTSFNQQGEQRFAQQQQKQQTPTKNGYQRLQEETAAFIRPDPSAGPVMSVDYTI